MYAAGTGLTPMYQILNLLSVSGGSKCTMIFCNKELKDILLKKKLDSWAANGILQVHYVLSQAKDWSGPKGRISSELVSELIKPNNDDDKEFHLICGPDGFVKSVQIILETLKVDKSKIHTF